MSRQNVSFVIPCLNEEAGLVRVLDRLGALRRGPWGRRRSEVLVVDNASTDGSARVAERAGARLLRCPQPGYGWAVRAGLEAARYAVALCLDADDACDVASVPALVGGIEAGADLVVGSRRLTPQRAGAVSWLHHHVGTPFLGWVLNARLGVPGGPRLSDVTSGFFALRRDRLEGLALRSRGFDLNVELYGRALRAGWRVEERPVLQLDALPGRRPHLRTWIDGCRVLRRLALQ